MSKHNAIDKELMKQAETACGFDPDMFADLIRADERDRAMRENAYVAAEREACAKVCEDMKGQCWAYDHDQIAAKIRARSNT